MNIKKRDEGREKNSNLIPLNRYKKLKYKDPGVN
jgi:hypothetical protein